MKAESTLSHYELLGLASTATQAEIRSAFKLMSQKCHPDKGGTEEHYKLIRQAYKVLSNPKSRMIYDTGMSEELNPREFEGAISAIALRTITEVLDQIDSGFNPLDHFRSKIRSVVDQDKRTLSTINSKFESMQKKFSRIKNAEKSMFIEAYEQKEVEIRQGIHSLKIKIAACKFILKDLEQAEYEAEEPNSDAADAFSLMYVNWKKAGGIVDDSFN